MMQKIYIVIFTLFIGVNAGFSQSTGFEEIKNLELIDLIYENLDKFYVDEPKIGAISKAAIDAMLQELDPYTVYYHESNIEDYRLLTTGQYGGIGALIRKIDEYIVIAEPYQGFPAYNAGLKAGDKIISIDGRDMKNKDTEFVSEALKGPKGSNFILKIERNENEIKEIKLERDEIKIPDVPYFGIVDEKSNTGYIKLNSFTQTASKDVKEAFLNLQEKGMEKLILDLRGNGGGLLMEAVNIVNFFVPENVEIVKTKGRVIDQNMVYKTRNKPLDLSIPVVVLVDESSASASEIVSGSLQDLDRAVIIGNTTFGKGLVQRTVDLKYGAKMKLTIAKYYTPSGRCVQKLDYYHKNEGEIDEVPDSLIQVFYTSNGREVIDGRGIEPDITIEDDELSKLTASLILENVIFNYATEFSKKYSEIETPENFMISEQIYDDFKKFALNKEFEYKTATQKQLERLIDIAKKEGYEEVIKEEYEILQNLLKSSKEKDLELFKKQIKEVLSNEIVSRYYFQEGRVINAFYFDNDLKKAIEILNDADAYKAILIP